MLENQLFLRPRFKQNREFIEASDPARQLRAVQEVHNYCGLLAANSVQEGILNILGSLFAV